MAVRLATGGWSGAGPPAGSYSMCSSGAPDELPSWDVAERVPASLATTAASSSTMISISPPGTGAAPSSVTP